MSTPHDLKKSEKFKDLTVLLPASGKLNFVNETQGSYLVIENSDTEISVTIYTSGLFDLVPIRSQNTIEVCEDNNQTYILIGSRQIKESIAQHGDLLIIGNGGPRGKFKPGRMPASLQRLHRMDSL